MADCGSYIITMYKAIKLHEEREKKRKERKRNKEKKRKVRKKNLILTTRSTLS